MSHRHLITFLVIALVTPAVAQGPDHTSQKLFAKPVPEVVAAAERAARRMQAEVRGRKQTSNTVEFSSSRQFRESISGYHATFTAEIDRKTGKTAAKLVVSPISASSAGGSRRTAIGKLTASNFFAYLKEELGLCKNCSKATRVGGGGAVLIPH